MALVQRGAQIGAAKLWYDKPNKQFYLLVSLEMEIADSRVRHISHVVGVDVGQRYLAVATDTQDRTAFYGGEQVRARADHYTRLRKRLQRKGTRSATRRLIVVSGRERRFKQDRNHLISRRIVDAYPTSLIGLEDLTHIRERTESADAGQARHYEATQSKPRISKWAFAELHS